MPPSMAQLHARLQAFPGAELEHPFGPEVAVYKLCGKIFAILAEGEAAPRMTLKCDPVLAEALRQEHPAVRPGYHTNKRHWNTVYLETPIPRQVVWDMMAASYDLVRAALPRRVRMALHA
jgi:predicted DNA-binding protein (MmcQ/YjbR family)